MDNGKKKKSKCQVCLSHYKYKGPEPHLLPCLHSVCSTCVSAETNRELTCYVCKETFQKEDSDFPKNAVLAKEIFLATVQNNPSEILCTNREDGKQAKSWCQECKIFLCETCQEYHSVIQVSKTHALIPLTTFVKSGEGISGGIYCQDHKNHPLELFDETCGKVLCYKCLKQKHSACEVDEIDSVYDCLKESRLKKGMESLAGKLDDIGDVEAKIEDLSSKLDPQMEKVRESVEHTFSDLRNALDEREKEVLLQLRPCFKSIKDNNENRLAYLEQERSRCKAAVEFSEQCLDLSSPIDLSRLKTTLDSRTTTCVEAHLPKIRKEESFIHFSETDVQDLKEFITTFGEYYTSISKLTPSHLPCEGRVTSLETSRNMYEQKNVCLEKQLNLCTEKLRKIPEIIDGSLDTGTIRLTVGNIADPELYEISETSSVKNIPWYLSVSVKKDELSLKTYLAIFLNCDRKENGPWSCETRADFKVLQQEAYGKDFCRKMKYTFKTRYGYGYPHFIHMKDLLEPSNGYLKEGTVVIEADVVVVKTTGICGLKDLLKNECSLSDLESIETEDESSECDSSDE